MATSRNFLTGILAACAVLACAAAAAAGADIAAVVSSDSGAYAEAFSAFKAALGGPVDYYNAAAAEFEPPSEAHFAVAFGARAAALEYPSGMHRIYALAPVTGRGSGWHEISMMPEPAAALAAYRGLQPGLRRLAVLWDAYPGEKYIAELQKAGAAAGVEVLAARLKSPDQLPERLRRLMGKMDAFWLMPDPALITPGTLLVMTSFACANSIPFYAPTHALVANGATAAFAPDFAEAGAAAARAVAVIRGGGKLQPLTYPANARLTSNDELIEKCRWPVRKK